MENKKYKISRTAKVSKNARIGKQVYIGPYVIIEDNVIIEDEVKVEAGCFIGENSCIKKKTHISANVTIHHDVFIGKKCR